MVLLVSLFLFSSTLAASGPVLAVFAHPDDESATIATLLSRYAKEGHDVYLIVVTSGQVGDSNTDIPRGDQLGAAREKESRCSCKALGIHDPAWRLGPAPTVVGRASLHGYDPSRDWYGGRRHG